jgi:hypothetical protein
MSARHNAEPATPSVSRHQVRLPGFVPDESIGLGDVVKRLTSTAGVRPCGGCADRAQRLNSWLVFTGRRG